MAFTVKFITGKHHETGWRLTHRKLKDNSHDMQTFSFDSVREETFQPYYFGKFKNWAIHPLLDNNRKKQQVELPKLSILNDGFLEIDYFQFEPRI